jgi:hypothetical protein
MPAAEPQPTAEIAIISAINFTRRLFVHCSRLVLVRGHGNAKWCVWARSQRQVLLWA